MVSLPWCYTSGPDNSKGCALPSVCGEATSLETSHVGESNNSATLFPKHLGKEKMGKNPLSPLILCL